MSVRRVFGIRLTASETFFVSLCLLCWTKMTMYVLVGRGEILFDFQDLGILPGLGIV
jgi:hypothetical protein